MPKTVKAKLLLGWMPQDEALQFLLEKCVFDPPMTRDAAIALWQQYRDKVQGLGKRDCPVPQSFKMSLAEKMAVEKFIKTPRPAGAGADKIHRVQKIDPRGLVLHQFYVVTERSEEYVQLMHNTRQRTKYCMGLDQQAPAISTVGTVTTVTLPHFEYDVNAAPGPNGTLAVNIKEWPRYMSAVDAGGKLLLWGGYHRSYSFLSHAEPDGPEELPLVTLISSPLAHTFFSQASTRPSVRDCVLGDCPALFEDFFKPELYIEVSFRKQKRVITFDSATQTLNHAYVDEL